MSFHGPTTGGTEQTKANPKTGAPAYWINQLMTATGFAYLLSIAAVSFIFRAEHQTWTASTVIAAVSTTLAASIVPPIAEAEFLSAFWSEPVATIISDEEAPVALVRRNLTKMHLLLRLWCQFRCTRLQFGSANRWCMTHLLEVSGRAKFTKNSNRLFASFSSNWCPANLKVICRSPVAWPLRQIYLSEFSDQKAFSPSQTSLAFPDFHLQFAFNWQLESTLCSPLKFFRVIWDYRYS